MPDTWTLSRIGPEAKAAVPALIEALKDEDIHLQVAITLGEIGPEAKEAILALIESFKDEDDYLRYNSEMALKKINTTAAQKAIKDYEKKSG
jgi:HEAT repeat protein